MASHSHSMDAQSQSSDLAAQIVAASTPPQIAAAITAVESFLHRHPRDQSRWFFSLTFPTLICKTFGFDDPPPLPSHRPPPPSTAGWIDIVSSSNDPDLASRFLNLLSPDSVLMSSMSAVDHLSLIKYVFPIERLPEWVRFALSNVRYCTALADSCPLFKGNKISTTSQGSSSSCQVELNVFEYYIFWFSYYPVCKRNCEYKYSDTPNVSRSDKKSRLENWACSIPRFSTPKRGSDQKVECSGLYVRLLYMYLGAFVPVSDLGNAWQPYRSSLLHYSAGLDSSKLERAEFLVCAMVQFWLVDNDFSPLPMNLCKSFGGCFPFRAVVGETPPTSGLGEVVNVFVKYLNLSSAALTEVSHQAEYTESPRWQASGNTMSVSPGVPSIGCWNLWVQRPLYRFILRTFLFCPMETSIKNASQLFSVWISYMEPWAISLEDFKESEAEIGAMAKRTTNMLPQAAVCGYSSSWQGYVLSNYLFYSSLVLHFIGFAHKFLHTDPKVVVQMVSKVINILTSSGELLDLIKNVDIAFHSHPTRSSKSMLTSLYRLVPAIREQLQDWEDGLCESSADGSFLHENWNKDLRLFSDGEDGGQQLLQLFILRAESELQSTSGDNLPQCIDSLKTGLGKLFGCHIMKPITNPPEERQHQGSCNEIFKPRRVRNGIPADIKYKGEWMKRPVSDDEVGWLANLLVRLSGWLNENLGLNGGESSYVDPAYVDVPGNASDVYGPTETAKVLLCSAGTWFAALCRAAVGSMKKHGLKVNLRVFASKKVVMFLLVVVAMSAVRRAVAESRKC